MGNQYPMAFNYPGPFNLKGTPGSSYELTGDEAGNLYVSPANGSSGGFTEVDVPASTTTLNATFQNIYYTSPSTSLTITLPNADSMPGGQIGVYATNSDITNIATTASQNIDGNPPNNINPLLQGIVIFTSLNGNWASALPLVATAVPSSGELLPIANVNGITWQSPNPTNVFVSDSSSNITQIGPLTAIYGGTGSTLFTFGQATFVSAGSVAVSDTSIDSSSIITVTPVATTPPSEYYSVSVTAGTGFTIYSSNSSSSATVNYIRVN